MHNILIGDCRTGAKSVRKQNNFGLYLIRNEDEHIG